MKQYRTTNIENITVVFLDAFEFYFIILFLFCVSFYKRTNERTDGWMDGQTKNCFSTEFRRCEFKLLHVLNHHHHHHRRHYHHYYYYYYYYYHY